MNVREKLAELLDNAIIDSDDNYGFPNTKQVAEHLIANGVTVQERGQWIYDFDLTGSNFYRCSVCNRQETLFEKRRYLRVLPVLPLWGEDDSQAAERRMILDCKCKECLYRIALAIMFDIHIWKEDCDRYETDHCGSV